MQVTLNGEPRELPDNLTLQELLQRLQLDADRVAVEHNREIIKRDRWATVKVQAGDQLEIVHLVGGG
ncbi:MAG: thiamine biosynthesis protein ThiS [Acidobacteria bacterium RIFCSPHIGHO2_02_FULL_67_57]|nr:MAG: thiamine biosynthesis protein ThiS [Acidobacteria bacterium RIFCSPHIGHO2_02_FULL_67_57]